MGPLPILLILFFTTVINAKPTVMSGGGNTVVSSPGLHEVKRVDLIIGSLATEGEVLEAYFSGVGSNYETKGDIVQISYYRACESGKKDHTVNKHIVVVFVDTVQSFLAGCVALDNQARFVEKSGAHALIVGSATKLSRHVKPNSLPTSIPVIILDEIQTKKLKDILDKTRVLGGVAHAEIQFEGVSDGTLNMSQRESATLRLQVFRPTILNISLICLLAFLVVLISAILIVKLRWHPTAHHDLWMRALALKALKNMETRKFTKLPSSSSKKLLTTSSSTNIPPCVRTRLGSLLPRFSSLHSVSQSTTGGQERCSICLDDFVEGTQLRVLFCGHEFHSVCVDPWLLSKRRCPLCQFDVVEKRWPEIEKIEKRGPTTTVRGETSGSMHRMPSFEEDGDQLRPLLSVPLDPYAGPATPIHVSYAIREYYRQPRNTRRSRSIPRRRPLRDRNALQVQISHTIGPLSLVSGYSSDVSSYPDGQVDL